MKQRKTNIFVSELWNQQRKINAFVPKRCNLRRKLKVYVQLWKKRMHSFLSSSTMEQLKKNKCVPGLWIRNDFFSDPYPDLTFQLVLDPTPDPDPTPYPDPV